MLMLIKFFQLRQSPVSFSRFLEKEKKDPIAALLRAHCSNRNEIKILAYCLMPTHFHLAVEGASLEIIAKYSSDVLNSYTKYFNRLHNRKGPLWQSRSKKVLCESNEQLLHLTRYIHLNPVTAYLVNKPEDWKWASYPEYMEEDVFLPICEFKNRLDLRSENYAFFVNSNIEYQRKLAEATSVNRVGSP